MTQSFATAVLSDAREYLTERCGIPMHDLPASSVKSMIESFYLGGWAGYEIDFRARQPKATEELSPIKLKARVQEFTKRRLSEYDQILMTDFGDLVTKIVISKATVTRTARRDIVTARTILLYTFTRNSTNELWSKSVFDFTEEADEVMVRFGAVMTPERAAAMAEQVETCYRPGTDRTPMQGWAARLGISHKEAHKGEAFQAPIKEDK